MSDVSEEILQLEESMSLDEPEGAVALPVVSTPQETPEIPESREVTLAREGSPLSDTEPWVRVRSARSQEELWTIRIPRTVAVRTVRVEVRGRGLSPYGEPPQFL